MSTFLVLAMAAVTHMTGLQTSLQPSEAEEINIEISVIDLEKEARHPYPLFLFEVNLSQFDVCKLRGVWIQLINHEDQLVFTSSIGEESGLYYFQLLEQYLNGATLGITCDAGPDTLDPSYTIDLREYGRTP